MKALILKPVMWNTNGYMGPSGYPSHSGYSKTHGYGHEEWNNHPARVWRGFRVFHTEANESLLRFSGSGDLGIVMVAAHDGTQYAVGLATNVYHNTNDEMQEIAETLGLRGRSEEIWAVEHVRNCFGGDKALFLEEWDRQYAWLRWRCPEEHFFWFADPVPLDPQGISGKRRLIQMHGRYQLTMPSKVLPFILQSGIPRDHECLLWLTEGEFHVAMGGGIAPPSGQELRKQHRIKGRNSTAARRFEYWVEGKRTVEPLHGRLQSQFVKFLAGQGIQCVQDEGYLDVQYVRDGQTFIVEVKPTENIDTRYAVRIAVGQLLEYRFHNAPGAQLEIVLGTEPRASEKAFVISLGMHISYLDGASGTFVRLGPAEGAG